MLSRHDQMVLEVERESAFADGATFGGSELRSRIWDVDLSGADSELIADAAYQIAGGSPGAYEGLAKARAGGVSWKHYLEGLGSACTTGDPSETALSVLLEILFQGASDALAGSQINAAATTTSVTVATADSKEATAAIGLGSFQLPSGRHEIRPFTESADTLTMLMALSEAPAEDAYAYGGLNYLWSIQPASLLSAAMQFVGSGDEQHAKLAGAVLAGKIASVDAGQVPVLECEAFAAEYSEPSETRVAASNAYGAVMAGGNVAMSGYGDTDVSTYRAASVEVDFRGAWEVVPNPNLANGTAGFVRAPELPEAVIQIPLIDTPPAALAAASFRAWARDNLNSSNDGQLVLSFGAAAGRQVGCYWSQCRLLEWSRVEAVGGLAYQQLRIGSVDGGQFYLVQT